MLRRTVTFAFAGLLMAGANLVSQAAYAAPIVKAERPDVKVGDKYTFSCSWGAQKFEQQNVITSVDESSIKYTQNGKPLENTREGNPVKDARFTYSDRRNLSFPLEVGKKWTFTDDWARFDPPLHGSAKANVTVASYEKVRVPAGEFDAFKIERTADFRVAETGSSGTNTGVHWYAPAARTNVKRVTYIVGEPEFTCELKEFQLQP